MDAAKGISVMAVHDEPIDQYYGVGVENIVNPLPPMILIPTTAGTGSETSRSGIITNTAKKRKEVLRSGMANVALVDPSLTLGMPPFLTAATGLDALSHNIEALETNVYNPIAEAIAYEGIRLIAQSLVRAVEDGTCQSAREDMAMASSMGALAFQKGLCISHSIAHQISPMFGTHHGVAIAVTLPYTMEFNISAAPDKFSRIASAFGCADPTPEKAVDEVRKLIKRIQLPSSLSEIGVPKESLDEIAKNAMNDWCIKFNPKPVSEKDINVLCQQAFNNRN
jgi:alcohol dehydrogenase class IV